MKRIILIDPRGEVFKSIIDSKEFTIDTLIVDAPFYSDDLLKKYPEINIYNRQNFNNFLITLQLKLDYDLISKFKSTQLKNEHFYSRFTSDINMVQYFYAIALHYWFGKINNQIDLVLLNSIEHGAFYDTTAIDVARYLNKPTFILQVSTSNAFCKRADAIYDYTNRKFIDLGKHNFGLERAKVDDFIFNSNISTIFKHYEEQNKKRSQSFKSKITSMLDKIGGVVLTSLVYSIIYRKPLVNLGFNITFWQCFTRNLYLRKLRRYYESISEEFDDSKKYIYYSMHMEPEASIQVNTIFTNQLTIIKLISDCLPSSWVLYVKEHPHQFKLNSNARAHFLPTIDKFRTEKYYDQIKLLKNVKLLRLNTETKEVVSGATAVSTIRGTVLYEAISLGKPVLSFSQGTTILTKINDVFEINNEEECENAICILEKGYKPNYSNFKQIFENFHYLAEDHKPIDINKLMSYLLSTKAREQ